MTFKRNDDLFSEMNRLTRWIHIEQAFIQFLIERENLTKEGRQKILEKLKINPFELIGYINGGDDEYKAFKNVFLSKIKRFDIGKFMYGIDHVGFITIGNSLLIKEWYEKFLVKLDDLQDKLKNLAFKYKNLTQIGRTHGVHGEPTSFGYRFAVAYDDIGRYARCLFENRKFVEVVSFNYDSLLDPSIAADLHLFLSKKLGLFCETGNFAGFSRGRYFDFIGSLNGLAQVIHKYVIDISFLSEYEVGEIEASKEIMDDMVSVELSSQIINSNVSAYIDLGMALHSDSPEFAKQGEKCIREVMRHAIELIEKFIGILENMHVNVKVIDRNLSNASQTIYSQKVLLYLIDKTGISRDVLANDVKELVMESNNNYYGFRGVLETSKYSKFFSSKNLDILFDKDSYLVNIDQIYRKIFSSENQISLFKKIVWNEWQIKYAIEKLAYQINREYGGSKLPVSLVVFAERSLTFAGHLITKLHFPVTIINFPHSREDLEIKSIDCDSSLIRGRRTLIVDFVVHKNSNLDHFIDKLKSDLSAADVKICSLLKFNDVTDEKFVVSWFGFECSPDDFYAGFGKNCGSRDSFRNFPFIGLVS